MVEFGVVLPIIALLIAGLIGFGLMASTEVSLRHAAREGARALALTGDPGQAVSAVRNASPVDGIGVSTGGSCDPERRPGEGDVRVEVTYDFSFWPIERAISTSVVMRCGA